MAVRLSFGQSRICSLKGMHPWSTYLLVKAYANTDQGLIEAALAGQKILPCMGRLMSWNWRRLTLTAWQKTTASSKATTVLPECSRVLFSGIGLRRVLCQGSAVTMMEALASGTIGQSQVVEWLRAGIQCKG
jgi:hypothetical protein